MAKNHLDDFELFYQEIPASRDYLKEPEIEDLIDDTDNQKSGLSVDQVSELAKDALATNHETRNPESEPPTERASNNNDTEQQLF